MIYRKNRDVSLGLGFNYGPDFRPKRLSFEIAFDGPGQKGPTEALECSLWKLLTIFERWWSFNQIKVLLKNIKNEKFTKLSLVF